MDFRGQISNGKFKFSDPEKVKLWTAERDDSEFIVSIVKRTRTSLQHRAIHLLFRWIAEALNEKHIYFGRNFFKENFELEWTADMTKNLIWKPIQKIVCGSDSTTKLKTDDIQKVSDAIFKNMSDKFGIILSFPDEQMKQLGIKPYEVVKKD